MLATTSAWSTHLSGDVGVFFRRVVSFRDAGSWAGLGANEYQPGALFFFLIPEGIAQVVSTDYTTAFFTVNAVLLVLHVLILRYAAGPAPAWATLLLFLAAGPISLYRFELIVSFLVLLGVLLWWKHRAFLSGLLFGIAAATKVYPLFLVPLLLRSPDGRFDRRRAFSIACGTVVGLGGVILLYLLMGGSIDSLTNGLRYHAEKPVSVFSVLGIVLLLAQGLTGLPIMPVNTYGIHGLLVSSGITRLTSVGLLFTLVLAYVLRPRKHAAAPSFSLMAARALCVLMAFLVWQTGFQPQYLLWPIVFSALLVTRRSHTGILIVVSHALALVALQPLFPTGFSPFLEGLYGAGIPSDMLIILAVFLFALLILAGVTVRTVYDHWTVPWKRFL